MIQRPAYGFAQSDKHGKAENSILSAEYHGQILHQIHDADPMRCQENFPGLFR
jgi:hypothetical protein